MSGCAICLFFKWGVKLPGPMPMAMIWDFSASFSLLAPFSKYFPNPYVVNYMK